MEIAAAGILVANVDGCENRPVADAVRRETVQNPGPQVITTAACRIPVFEMIVDEWAGVLPGVAGRVNYQQIAAGT